MEYNVDEIISENEKRNTLIKQIYDPYVGTEYCDDIKRFKLYVRDAVWKTMYLPIEMEHEPIVELLKMKGSMSKCARTMYRNISANRTVPKQYIREIWRYFLKLRCKYDFEFWCAWQIKIKQKGKALRDYFILNRAQRYYLATLEKLRKAGEPIDIILLKARQWGGSTMTQFYMMWIQMMHRQHWNSVIVGDVEKQAKVVLQMLEGAAADYDTFIDEGNPVTLKPYGRTDSIREIVGRECTISVGSMQKPDKLRGEDTSMAHLTEVGLWKETLGKKPEDLIESIIGGMLQGAYTLIVLESTAKGVGNYFYNTWIAAEKKENNFSCVFVPWHMIDIYSKSITDKPTFIDSMTDYEWWQWRQGATLEAINWYRLKSRTMDEVAMKSEYPTTATEAFQSTGSPYFKNEYLDEAATNVMRPIMQGEIVSISPLEDKVAFLRDIRFEQDSRGKLKVWKDVDNSQKMNDRYLVTVDLGKGGSDTADNTIVCVWDRYWQQEGEDGYPEVVAEWAGKEPETDLLAWRIAQIASYYNNALLVIESNTIETSKEARFRAVLDQIKDYYPNIYKRAITNKTDVGNTGMFRYGWNTSHSSKEEICSNLDWALRSAAYVERCQEAIDEMRIFVRRADGSLGNIEGRNNHDDRVITRALGIHFCYWKMDKPRLITQNNNAIVINRAISEHL